MNGLNAHKSQSTAITCLYCAGQQMPYACYSAKRRCSCCPSQPHSSTAGYPVVFPSLMDYGVLYLSSFEKKKKNKKGDGQKLFCFDALSIWNSSPHYDGTQASLPGLSLALRLTQNISNECSNNLNPEARVLKWKLASTFSMMILSPAWGLYPGVYQLILSHTFHLQQASHYLKPIEIIPVQHKEKMTAYWDELLEFER